MAKKTDLEKTMTKRMIEIKINETCILERKKESGEEMGEAK